MKVFKIILKAINKSTPLTFIVLLIGFFLAVIPQWYFSDYKLTETNPNSTFKPKTNNSISFHDKLISDNLLFEFTSFADSPIYYQLLMGSFPKEAQAKKEKERLSTLVSEITIKSYNNKWRLYSPIIKKRDHHDFLKKELSKKGVLSITIKIPAADPRLNQ